jgi:hypothetical protein
MKSRTNVIVCCISIIGCSESSGPTDILRQDGITQTPQWCETHPVECGIENPDPFPNEPGLYLGTSITMDNCSEGAGSPGGDADHDGFGDYCEEIIAQGFAPQLAYSTSDIDMGRESYWAVRPDDFVYYRVHIFYALGYYRDGGSPHSICQTSFPPAACQGHLGDSEGIHLLVDYNSSTGHWAFVRAEYSQHGSYPLYTPGEMIFPVKYLGFPRAYVALGKHANYPRVSDCGSYDDCQTNATVRVTVSSNRNMGSRSYPIRGCVGSEQNFSLQQLGYVECFWTATYFTGWSGDNSGQVAGYKNQLSYSGF